MIAGCGTADVVSAPPSIGDDHDASVGADSGTDSAVSITICFEAADCDTGLECRAYRCLQGTCVDPPSNDGWPCDGGVCFDGGCKQNP